MRGVEGLSSTLKGKDGSSHRFQKPSGPQRPSAWRLRIRIKRRITSPWGLLFVSFSSSSLSLSLQLLQLLSSASPPLFPLPSDSRSSRVRSRRQSVRKGGTRAAQSFRMNFVCIPSNCIPSTRFLSARVLQAALPRTFSSPRLATPPRSFPFSLLSNDRPTDTASTRRPIVAAGLSFNLSIITLVSIRWIIRCCDEEEIVNGSTK